MARKKKALPPLSSLADLTWVENGENATMACLSRARREQVREAAEAAGLPLVDDNGHWTISVRKDDLLHLFPAMELSKPSPKAPTEKIPMGNDKKRAKIGVLLALENVYAPMTSTSHNPLTITALTGMLGRADITLKLPDDDTRVGTYVNQWRSDADTVEKAVAALVKEGKVRQKEVWAGSDGYAITREGLQWLQAYQSTHKIEPLVPAARTGRGAA